MPLIYVRARPGSKVTEFPNAGRLIPTDKFVPVMDSPRIQRLINVHEDLVLQEGKSESTDTPKSKSK